MEAAREIFNKVKRYYPDVEHVTEYLFIDAQVLLDKCADASIDLNKTTLRGFAMGFTMTFLLFNMVYIEIIEGEVGTKIKEHMEMQFSDLGCLQILIACSLHHLEEILGEYQDDLGLTTRVTFIEIAFKLDSTQWDGVLGRTRFRGLFQTVLFSSD